MGHNILEVYFVSVICALIFPLSYSRSFQYVQMGKQISTKKNVTSKWTYYFALLSIQILFFLKVHILYKYSGCSQFWFCYWVLWLYWYIYIDADSWNYSPMLFLILLVSLSPSSVQKPTCLVWATMHWR